MSIKYHRHHTHQHSDYRKYSVASYKPVTGSHNPAYLYLCHLLISVASAIKFCQTGIKTVDSTFEFFNIHILYF